ncbi:coiled-coil domain-containing protein 157-like isoform X2 [Sceloporus undulatus]|nr:coiled-coil domain-containing protein 157-like isoform X2 [Sceloporus undulatus]
MLGLAVDRERMESLQEDIIDLQGMVVTVFSQAGAVHYPSWKFPDKASCDLDLVPLLDRYGFAEDNPELTTRSHIVLLELIIDRLLLLLQSFTVYAGSLVHEEATSPSSATTGPSMSIGMAARTYWESMVKLGAFYQQLAKEKKGCEDGAPNPSRTEDTRVKSSCFERSESDVTIPGLQASSLASSAGSGLLHGDRTERSEAKSTPGPSPAPCDTCEKAQLSLREAGHAIIGMCTSQNLPSSLGKFLGTLGETLEHRPLTAMDISYWASEQNKDLSRIRKHLRTLTELIGPLKEELEASREQEEEMRRRIEAFEGRLQKEKEAQEEQRKQAGLLFEQRHQEILQTVAQLEKEKEDLQDSE